jgi:hypothetical protein
MLRTGLRPHFIGYYVLVMSLQGRPWNDCKGAEKDTLRVRFDALVAEARGGAGTCGDRTLPQRNRHRAAAVSAARISGFWPNTRKHRVKTLKRVASP